MSAEFAMLEVVKTFPIVFVLLQMVALFWGFIAAWLASKRARSPIRWFFAGYFFEFFAVWALALCRRGDEKNGASLGATVAAMVATLFLLGLVLGHLLS